MILILLLLVVAFPVSPVDPGSLIDALGDPRIEVRNRSHAELRAQSGDVAPLLRLHAAHPDPEVAARCRELLLHLGKVVLVNPGQSRVAVELRESDRASVGERLRVTRDGRIVGVVEIFEVLVWGSWAKPVGQTLSTDFRAGDITERIISTR